MWPNSQETADLVTFTEEIFNGKLPFFLQWLFYLLTMMMVCWCSKSYNVYIDSDDSGVLRVTLYADTGFLKLYQWWLDILLFKKKKKKKERIIINSILDEIKIWLIGVSIRKRKHFHFNLKFLVKYNWKIYFIWKI